MDRIGFIQKIIKFVVGNCNGFNNKKSTQISDSFRIFDVRIHQKYEFYSFTVQGILHQRLNY